MSAATKRKVWALAMSALYLALIGFGSIPNPYSKAADLFLLGLPLVYLMTLSIMLLWNRARNGHPLENGTLLQRWWRWVTDNYPVSDRPR
jgi:hypothetical protein